jgi:hypothetical protein
LPNSEQRASLDKLLTWRSGSPLLAVRWLHALYPADSANLCSELADDSTAKGWNVLGAVPAPTSDREYADQSSSGPTAANPEGTLLSVHSGGLVRWQPLTG